MIRIALLGLLALASACAGERSPAASRTSASGATPSAGVSDAAFDSSRYPRALRGTAWYTDMALPEVKREIRFMYSYTPNGLVVYDGRDIKRDIEGHIKLVNQSSGKLSVADWRVSGGDTLCHKRRTLPTEPPESEYCEPTRITGDVMRSGEATWHRMSYDPRSAEIADSIAAFIASKRTATASPK